MPNWFYTDANGQKQGLINDQQLKALAVQGIITPQTQLETESGHKGLAGQIKGLFPAVPPQVQPVAAPIPVQNAAVPKTFPLHFVIGGGVALLIVIVIVVLVNIASNNSAVNKAESDRQWQATQDDYNRELEDIENELMRKYDAESEQTIADALKYFDVLPKSEQDKLMEVKREAQEANRKYAKQEAKVILLERQQQRTNR
jgi:hypothetical protein